MIMDVKGPSPAEFLDGALRIGVASLFFLSVKAALIVGPGRRMLESIISTNKRLVTKQVSHLVSQTASRVVGFLHNAIQVPFALYLLSDETMQSDHIYAFTPMSQLCMCITAGYFLVDLLICIWKYHEEGPLYLMHASFAFVLFAHGVISNLNHYYGAAFLMWEVSTPFVHLRWIMHKMDMGTTKIYFYNGLLMLLTFFGCRCVWGMWVSYDFWARTARELVSPTPGGFPPVWAYIFRLANVALTVLNFYWFSKMVAKAAAFLVAGAAADQNMQEKGE
ncbi:unnamed protein product [Ostreobium quekettii]|uniref:TLC domain-containing protein n=1 Tax=Ostreobium quekettii TaxID=121088 RepID=A0A8S1IM73_9CHLO|nr:unnamed protein product [Ostreobium quekettii]|eukprot:evm.model.scf_1737.3 EVM.evm.TU.scf_1737.3   scf_1737:21482-25235(-)